MARVLAGGMLISSVLFEILLFLLSGCFTCKGYSGVFSSESCLVSICLFKPVAVLYFLSQKLQDKSSEMLLIFSLVLAIFSLLSELSLLKVFFRTFS